jgi:hypothetical protein
MLRRGADDCAGALVAVSSAMKKITTAGFIWACFSKGGKNCQTLYYMIRMWKVALFLVLTVLPTAAAKSPHCTLRVHAQADAHDGSVFATPITTPLTGKNIFSEKIPTLSERDVAAFRAYPARDGSFGVLFQFNDHGRLALETLSMEHRGNTLLVFLNGRPVTELMVDRRVADGKLYIASGLTATDVEAMKKDWPEIGASKRR